jgi:hypothetical protein
MTSAELIDALRAHYAKARGWILLPQVRDATGARGNRTADAIALNAWPSRGLELHGFELKTYRGDWLRELKQPEKAESIFRYCDRWWIVTPAPVPGPRTDAAVVQPSELPPTWGLIHVAADGGAVVAKEASALSPAPLDRVFVAALMRSLEKCETPEALREASRKAGFKEGHEAGVKYATLRMQPCELELVRWKRESLEHLETSTKRILDGIRSELKDLQKLPSLPGASEDDDVVAEAR